MSDEEAPRGLSFPGIDLSPAALATRRSLDELQVRLDTLDRALDRELDTHKRFTLEATRRELKIFMDKAERKITRV